MDEGEIRANLISCRGRNVDDFETVSWNVKIIFLFEKYEPKSRGSH